MKKELISVIIPVYNAERYIAQCLESILKQNDPKIEIIIVNDGSKDNSDKICRKYRDKYSIIKYIHIENSGVSNARNIGIETANGEWICFVDADDELVKDTLKKVRLVLSEEIDVLCCNYRKEDSSLQYSQKICNIESKDAINYLFDYMGNKDRISKIFTCQNMIFSPCWGKIYRSSVIKTHGIKFPIELKLSEDVYFNFLVFSHCKNISVYDVPLYKYSMNPNSVTHKFSLSHIENRVVLIEYLTKINLSDHQNSNAIRKYILTVVLQLNGMLRNMENKDVACRAYQTLLQDSEIQLILHEYDNSLLSDGKIQQKYYRLVIHLLKRNMYKLVFWIGNIYGKYSR